MGRREPQSHFKPSRPKTQCPQDGYPRLFDHISTRCWFNQMIDPKTKVFCIGLPKTGTRSICEALRILRYKTIHYPKPLGAILGYDAAGDISVTVNWKFLDHVYPGSKFILTLRESKTWHRSTARHFAEYADNPYRQQMFGCFKYKKKAFQDAYDNHRKMVQKHFRKRANNLLLMNIMTGDGWEQLCPFLGKSIPEEPFPWLGKFKG